MRKMKNGECDFCHTIIYNIRKNQKFHTHCGDINKHYMIAFKFILEHGKNLDHRRKWDLIRAMLGNV